jgi:hypothetical protein
MVGETGMASKFVVAAMLVAGCAMTLVALYLTFH